MAKKTPGIDREQEYREEAERLALVPVADQREIIALYRQCAENPKLPKRDRTEQQARVAALERHLRRLNRTKKLEEKQ